MLSYFLRRLLGTLLHATAWDLGLGFGFQLALAFGHPLALAFIEGVRG